MAKYREEVCVNYECKGVCLKGREADHSGYCQKCLLYEPRAKKKHPNKKKEHRYKKDKTVHDEAY